MRQRHTDLLNAVYNERERVTSRRDLLRGGLKVAAGGAIAWTAITLPATQSILAQDTSGDMMFADDLDVLNYALTLEHLEYAFYRDGIGQFTFGAGPFNEDIDALLMDIRDHEGEHVKTLVQVISDLGGTPVEEAVYDFGYTDAASFLATAQALENTGVMAYDGAGAAIMDPQLLTAAGSIVAVEARHASYLNLINGDVPFPAAYETPASKDEILAIAGPFIVG